jgi:hypothetical protein
MDLPGEIRSHAEELLRRFCEARVPAHAAEKVRLLFKVRGQTITLLEERPHFQKPLLWTLSAAAQFRYAKGTGLWTLYCRDRNRKWWRFTPEPPSRDLADLIRAVDRDDTHIFWG